MEHTTPLHESQEISIRLEQYDDIFSDFDIRPYSRRAISVDFLEEMKRAAIDKSEQGIELALYAPEKERNASHEETIKERLAAHFARHYKMLVKEQRNVIRLGVSMVALGIICMIGAATIVFRDPTTSMLRSFLVVFLEPAAWFLLWEGMDQIIFNSKSMKPELDFYRKMSHAHGKIRFGSC